MTQLTRPRRGEGRMIAGVCAAVADGVGLGTGLVRLGAGRCMPQL